MFSYGRGTLYAPATPDAHAGPSPRQELQGYLAHKQQRPPRILQQAHA